LKNENPPNISINTRGSRPKVEIAMPQIKSLDLSGATQSSLTGFKSDNSFDLGVSGASQLDGQIEAGNVRADVSGASRVQLGGKGANLNLECSGASRAELGDFLVKDATVNLSGASRATINASGQLSGEASGASQLTYRGSPTLGSLQSSGASTIKPE
jgi:hypothetical protein